MSLPSRRWVAGLALAMAFGCREGAVPEVSAAPTVGSREAAIEVETVPVRRGALERRIVAPGSLVARRESRIGAEVSGRIEKVYVDEGDHVAAGDPLFRIDPSSYQAAFERAEAAVALARAELAQVEADLARARHLREQHVLSQQQLERLETQLAVARARVREAEAARRVAKRNLEKTLVRAPYAASVAQRLADEGTTALQMPQTIVVVLQETDVLEARVSLPESDRALVQVGDPMRLRVEGLAEPIETRVTTVGDTIDPSTRTFLVKAEVPNRDHRLQAGSFARVEILPRGRREALLVPTGAVRSEAGRTSVLTVREGRAVEVPVEIGATTEDLVEVLSGLHEGEAVIVGAAAQELADGTRVRVRHRGQGPA